ncbi:MAG: hypothetical protein ACLGHN_00430 [Bacteriovoracia bacterium]
MKSILAVGLCLAMSPVFANTWKYQVNINGNKGAVKKIDSSKSKFDAGPYYCEVTPVTVSNNTEYRSLVCAVGSGTVSTGGLCTQKGSKFPSVQFAILNLNGPKNVVNVVVSCEFD